MKRASAAVMMLVLFTSAASAAPLVDQWKLAARQMRGKLLQSVSTPAIEPNTPIGEALDFLSERFDLVVLLDIDAFRNDLKVEDLANQAVALRALNKVTLHTVLRLLLSQVSADYYVQADGVICVVPKATMVNRQIRQLVQTKFDKRSLVECMRELQEQTGVNIVVDAARAGELAKTPISAELNSASLESAVLIIADMAELTPVLIDNIYYITTAENAAKLQREQDKKREGVAVPVPNP